jgi:hypothetical protein
VPTFPNARYLIPEADYRFFHPDNAGARPAARTEDEAARQTGSLIVFQDSILPVERQIECIPMTISPRGCIASAPDHTPGMSVLWLDWPARRLRRRPHTPLQPHRGCDSCAFDEDLAAAAVTRKRVLTEATRRHAGVIPAHYPGHGGVTVVARGDSFMVDDWLQLTSI